MNPGNLVTGLAKLCMLVFSICESGMEIAACYFSSSYNIECFIDFWYIFVHLDETISVVRY
jgi:hypothetical protein